MYGRGGHLGHVTWTIYNKLKFPVPKESPHKRPSSFRECMDLMTSNNLYVYMYVYMFD